MYFIFLWELGDATGATEMCILTIIIIIIF